MIRILLFALLAWFLYKLIFRVIIPVYTATRQVKRQFNEMKAKMEEEQLRQQGFQSPPAPEKEPTRVPKSDYIDFEEIK